MQRENNFSLIKIIEDYS